MSFLDVVSDMMIPASIITIAVTTDADGNVVETPTTGETIWGVKYNRSEAARYFSKTWANDITDVFVTHDDYGIHKGTDLSIDGVTWACDEPQNVAELGEVFTIGIRRKS